jgi:WD40 repeat protein
VALFGLSVLLFMGFFGPFIREEHLESLAFSPDGAIFATGYEDGTITLWDTATQRKRYTLRGRSVVYSPDGRLLAAVRGHNHVAVWDAATGQLRTVLDVDAEAETPLVFAPDGQTLAIVHEAVRLVDVATGQVKSVLQEQPGMIETLAFAPDDKRVATGNQDGTVKLWDPATGQAVSVLVQGQGDAVTALAFAPDGQTLAWGTEVGSGTLWDVSLGKVRTTFPVRIFVASRGQALAYRSDSKTLAVIHGAVHVRDVATGQPLASFVSAPGPWFVTYVAGGRSLATCDYDKSIQLWDATRPAAATTLRAGEGMRSVLGLSAFAAAGLFLILPMSLVRLFHLVRGTKPCSQCGRRFVPGAADPDVELCPRCRTEDPSKRRRRFRFKFFFVVYLLLPFLVAFFGYGCSDFPREWWDLDFWPSYFIATVAVFIGLFVGLLGLALLIRQLLRSEKYVLNLARKSAGEDGHVVHFGPVMAWVGGPMGLGPVLEEEWEEMQQRFSTFLGEPLQTERRLRILCFLKKQDFTNYNRRIGFETGTLEGAYYLGHRKIALCGAASPKRLVDPMRILRVTLTFFFLETYKGFYPRQWLSSAIAEFLAAEDEDGERESLQRRMLVSVLKGTTLTSAEFFEAKANTLVQWMRNGHDPKSFRALTQFRGQAWSLVEYLCGRGAAEDNRERFRAFLRDLRRRDRLGEVFARHFGYGFEQLLHDWQQWVVVAGIAKHRPPPEYFRQALLENVLPLVRDPAAPLPDVITAVRDMGGHGYVLGADALIAVLHGGREGLRSEAVWALESISGQVLGEDPAKWEAWWNSLPDEVVPAAGDE